MSYIKESSLKDKVIAGGPCLFLSLLHSLVHADISIYPHKVFWS